MTGNQRFPVHTKPAGFPSKYPYEEGIKFHIFNEYAERTALAGYVPVKIQLIALELRILDHEPSRVLFSEK